MMPALAVDTGRFDEVKAAVAAGLSAYNDRFLPRVRDRHPLAISLRDADGRVIGGLTGELRLEWLYIDLFWLDDRLRGQGHGRRLLALAEAEARAFGATHMHLSTWSFQAPDFYQAMGFTEFGRLKDHPTGHDSIFFVKAIA